MSRPIIIDTDPGQDDAIGILLALASPEELDLLGIVAVAGNVPLDLTERNARALCELAGKPETKVFEGCSRPLLRPLVTAEHVHGKTGLDGSNLPEPTMKLQKQHGVDWIIEALLAAEDDSITLCLFAPQTNIGMAFSKAPKVLPKVREIVFMGGGFFEGGNITPAAEFNVYVDPHAADIVLNSGIPLVMMGLDVTHKVNVNDQIIENIKKNGNKTSEFFADLMNFYSKFHRKLYEIDETPLHDPCVIAYLIDSSIFQGKFVNVQVEEESILTRGETVVDWWGVTGRTPNCYVMIEANHNKFFSLLSTELKKLN